MIEKTELQDVHGTLAELIKTHQHTFGAADKELLFIFSLTNGLEGPF